MSANRNTVFANEEHGLVMIFEWLRLFNEEPPKQKMPASQALSAAISNLGDMVATMDPKIDVHPLPTVPVHEAHLVNLFQNIISNSLKYRDPERRPEIEVFAVKRETEWELCVSDNGLGFDPEYSDKIFRVFKRLHLRNQYSGNGIGLAICARIVAFYGGRIWANSQPGKGASFHFTLPA